MFSNFTCACSQRVYPVTMKMLWEIKLWNCTDIIEGLRFVYPIKRSKFIRARNKHFNANINVGAVCTLFAFILSRNSSLMSKLVPGPPDSQLDSCSSLVSDIFHSSFPPSLWGLDQDVGISVWEREAGEKWVHIRFYETFLFIFLRICWNRSESSGNQNSRRKILKGEWMSDWIQPVLPRGLQTWDLDSETGCGMYCNLNWCFYLVQVRALNPVSQSTK